MVKEFLTNRKQPDYSPEQFDLAERWERTESYWAYQEDWEAFKDFAAELGNDKLDQMLIDMYGAVEAAHDQRHDKESWPSQYWMDHDQTADRLKTILDMSRYLERPLPMIVGMKSYDSHTREMDDAEYTGRGFSVLDRRLHDHRSRTEWVHEVVGGKLAEARGKLLDRFSSHPSEESWNMAYQWSRAEGDDNIEGMAGNLPVENLIVFSERVRAETDPTRRYALTTEVAPDGRTWFESLETFTSESNEDAKQAALGFIVEKWRDGKHFMSALDLGTGSGESLAAVEAYAERVTGIDRVPELLEIARRKAKTQTELVQGDITKIPAADGSVDLISASGIFGSLGAEQERKVLEEIDRVMTDDGICIETSYARSAYGPNHPDVHKVTQSAKGMLADMVVDTVSGRAGVSRLTPEERNVLTEGLGYEQIEWIQGPSEGPRAHVRVLARRAANVNSVDSTPEKEYLKTKKYHISDSAELS